MRTVPLTHQRVTIQDDFDLDKILESGQCFRPRKLADGRCRFVSGKALLYLTPLGCGQYDAAWYGADWDVWAGYFDLGRSYAALRQSLAGQSAYLDAALAFGQGIRVLRQDPWEMLVTFIISQRKSIPAIRTAVEQLARCCGDPLCAEGDEVFLFPTPEQLCDLTEAQLTAAGWATAPATSSTPPRRPPPAPSTSMRWPFSPTTPSFPACSRWTASAKKSPTASASSAMAAPRWPPSTSGSSVSSTRNLAGATPSPPTASRPASCSSICSTISAALPRRKNEKNC